MPRSTCASERTGSAEQEAAGMSTVQEDGARASKPRALANFLIAASVLGGSGG